MRDECGRFTGRFSNAFNDKRQEAADAYWSNPKNRDDQAHRLAQTRKSLTYRARLTQANRQSAKGNRGKLRQAWKARREREQGGAVPTGFEPFYAYMTKYKPQGWKFWNCQVLLMCLDVEIALMKAKRNL